MNAFIFRCKRACHASQRMARIALRAFAPLTPARFDLLYIVYGSQYGIEQSELTRQLGVHPSTVSKMLSRLVELKLVFHYMDEDDHRQRIVSLTPDGRALMGRAIHDVSANAYVDLAVARAILPLRWYDAVRVDAKIRRINGTLRRLALVFYDTAVPLYAVPRPFPPPRPRASRRPAAHWPRVPRRRTRYP